MCKRDYSFSTKLYRHNKESAAHTSIVIPMGIPVYSPPIPTSGDTIPAENMLAKPSTAEALPAIDVYKRQVYMLYILHVRLSQK